MIEEEQPGEKEELKEPWYKGPIKYIIMLFLVLIIILWIVPDYSIKLDPEPKTIYSSIQKTRTFHPPTKDKVFLLSQLSKHINYIPFMC